MLIRRFEPSTAAALLLLVAAPLALTACEPPSSTYRRSTLRPALLGGQGAAPVEEGKVQVTGSASGRLISTNTPALGDPALHVATQGLAGEVRWGATPHLTVGGQLGWSHAAWTRPSADGTPPLGDAHRAAWSAGPSVTLHTGAAPGLFAALRLDASLAQLPWATWELEPGEAARCPPCEGGPPRYTAVDEGVEGHLLYGATLSGGYRFDAAITAIGGVRLENTVKNIGFSDELQEDSTITADVWAWTTFLGAQARLGDHLLLGGQVMWVVTDDVLSNGPGGMVTLGAEL